MVTTVGLRRVAVVRKWSEISLRGAVVLIECTNGMLTLPLKWDWAGGGMTRTEIY